MEEYKIKASIQQHLIRIKDSEYIKDFVRRNERKSPLNAKLDKDVVDYLFGEIEKLAKALILCNACQTLKLKEAFDYLQTYEKELQDFEQSIVEKASTGIIKKLDERRKEKSVRP